jgi:hypothetical protein
MRRQAQGAGPRGARRLRWALIGVLLAAQLPATLHRLIPVSHADDDDDAATDRVQVPSRLRIHDGQTQLLLSPAAVRNGGIGLARTVPAPVQGSVQAYGAVLDAATLTELASRYRSSTAQLAAARARAAASRAALERTRTLYQDRQNMSQAQLQGARSSAAADESALNAANAGTAALAAIITQSWGPVIATAVLQHGRLLDELINRRQFLVAVTLPPGIVPKPVPPSVTAQLPGGATIGLTFVSSGTTADPQVQGLRYYYRAAAAPELLSGLNLPVTLAVAGAAAGQVIPESAVVWLQGSAWIYRLLPDAGPGPSPGQQIFVRELITPERQTSDGGYVVRSLPGDAQIVVRGAQLLLSEEFRAQVQRQDND